MKKTITILLTIMMLVFAVGCSVQRRNYAIDMGVFQPLNENDGITVLSAEVDDGFVVVTVDLNLNSVKLQDFEKI